MQLNERGVKQGSHYYFFTPSETIKSYYYHLICCGHYFCDADYLISRDYFPHLLLLYVRSGELYVQYRGKSVTAKKGDVLLLDCREPHCYQGSDGLEFLYIHFDGPHSGELCRYIMKQHGFFFQHKRNVEIGKQLYRLVDTHRNQQELPISDCTCIIYNMINSLSARPENKQDAPSPVDEAIQFMKARVSKQVTLAEVAGHVNLSPYYFSHLFKTETGYAPIEFSTKNKIDTAKSLLKTTRLPVTDIAFQVGYSSSSGFINVFTKKVGLSPTEFRHLKI